MSIWPADKKIRNLFSFSEKKKKEIKALPQHLTKPQEINEYPYSVVMALL